MIRTVWKDICPKEIGHAQCHEHIWLEKGASYNTSPALCMNDYKSSLKELKDYRQAGGSLIVDAQPTGCGRNLSRLAELSRESGVHIVAAAGFHKKEFFDQVTLLTWSKEKLAGLYAQEIETGTGTPGRPASLYRAGILKAAAGRDWQTDPVYQKLFEAVAEAAGLTRAPVMIHTEKENDVLHMIRWFQERDIAPEKLLICHLDRTRHDIDYHKEVLSTGCFLCYDSIHRLKYLSEQEEMELLCAMKQSGLTGQIVLSLDTTNQRLRSYYAEDMGLDYLLTTFIPQLREHGFTDQEIRQMCITNARTILDFA